MWEKLSPFITIYQAFEKRTPEINVPLGTPPFLHF